ncbi:thermonuclease family protein [Candidatus Roizmanbacteria bacterium]|nr:thermonuclease family protein [Candidatus Roizmanbacteria bacterium]
MLLQDKFGRLLGYVFVDEVNLNIELVRNGLAKVVLYEKRAKIKYQDELLMVEKEAREKRVGIWNAK